MRAVAVREGGKTAADLCIIDVPRPDVGRGHVLIRVTHAGVNRPDILQRRGLYPPPPGASPIMGLEVAGVIEEIVPHPDGPPLDLKEDIGWRIGDRVCALVNGGGYADYVSVDIRHLLPVPEGLTMAEAASLPEVSLTVYANLIEHGGLRAGETVLVHGANSGIGSMTVMLGKAFDARVIATVRGTDRIDWVKALGADMVIDTAAGDFVEAVKAEGGADVILDIVAGDYVAKNILCLKPKGRLVQVGMARGNSAEIDVTRIMQKQAILTGSMLRPRPPEEKARLTSEVRAKVWPLIEAGAIRPVVAKTFPLAEVGAAHDFLDSGAHSGKVVLEF